MNRCIIVCYRQQPKFLWSLRRGTFVANTAKVVVVGITARYDHNVPGLCNSALLFHACSVANAIDNHILDYAKYIEEVKRRGTPPNDLGLKLRTTEGEEDTVTELGLRTCDGNPNCFSTTGDFLVTDR